MDSDTANPRNVVAKKVDSIIDLAITDIFNSKKQTGKIADPESDSSFIPEVKSRWLKLTDEEKTYLTESIRKQVIHKKNKKVVYNVSSYELICYFTRYILPYTAQIKAKKQDKNLTDMLIWANNVIDCLKNIETIECDLEKKSARRSQYYMENIQNDYNSAVNKFYNTYGSPSKGEMRVLKFKLLFDKRVNLLKHLLRERNAWQEIVAEAKLSWNLYKK